MTKSSSMLCLGLLSACIVRPTPSPRAKFIATTLKGRNVLMHRIDKRQWRISYNLTASCPHKIRQKEAELKALVIKGLKTWLQPLREHYPDREFTEDFLLVRQPDTDECEQSENSWKKHDMRITFDCKGDDAASFAVPGLVNSAPDVCMAENLGMRGINQVFTYVLVHELGHTFGLLDTYAIGKRISTGGLDKTAGKQPASIMSGMASADSPFHLGEDDKNGIIWLYKYWHEDHPVKDCFFPDHIFEPETSGCRHKFPLIFEAKHGTLTTVELILRNDPTLKINGRDAAGNTALHYAVRRLDKKMVEMLLKRVGIKVNINNKNGRTPAQLAEQIHQKHIAKLIRAHPSAKLPPWDVEAQDKKAVTWGELKRD